MESLRDRFQCLDIMNLSTADRAQWTQVASRVLRVFLDPVFVHVLRVAQVMVEVVSEAIPTHQLC